MVRLFVGDWDKNRANQNDPMAALSLLTGVKDCGAVKFHNSGFCRGVVACCLPWETKTLLNAKSENLRRKRRSPSRCADCITACGQTKGASEEGAPEVFNSGERRIVEQKSC
jgi:hypothetical protein